MRRYLAPLSLLVVLGLLAASLAPAARAAEDMDSANAALDRLEAALKKKKSINETLIAGLDEVMEAYTKLDPPPKPEPVPIPDDASDEDKQEIESQNKKALKDWETAVKKWEREAGKFKKDVRKVFVKAFKLVRANPRTKVNDREDVNIRAVEHLGTMTETEDVAEDVSKDIIKVLETVMFKAKNYDVTELLYEKAFAALGGLNQMKSLEYLIDNFTHTKSSPQKEVMKLRAAHKSMVLYRNVPGKTRYALVEEMVKQYSGVESQAEQSSSDPKIQEKKRFWDSIKADVIKALQYYAGEPQDADGQLIARMEDFQDWFRDHDNQRRAPWVDPKN